MSNVTVGVIICAAGRGTRTGFEKNKLNLSECDYIRDFVSEKLQKDVAEENIRNFYNAFGRGEFPFLTIIIIRLGNKDHYFYTIHR